MEDLGHYKFILYLLGALLYFFLSMKKKKTASAVPPRPVVKEEEARKPVRTVRSEKNDRPSEKPAPVSIEDLLNDFGKKEKAVRNEPPEGKAKLLKDKSSGITGVDENEGQRREETALSGVSIAGNSFGPYTTEQKPENSYTSMFRDPETVKKLIIAQEVLNPRHF